MESFAADLATMVRRPLEPELVAAMRKIAEVVQFVPGAMVQAPGAETALFHYVVSGELEVVDPATSRRQAAATLGPGRFFGDLLFFCRVGCLWLARAIQRTAMPGSRGLVGPWRGAYKAAHGCTFRTHYSNYIPGALI